jgi:hypothetical protein
MRDLRVALANAATELMSAAGRGCQGREAPADRRCTGRRDRGAAAGEHGAFLIKSSRCRAGAEIFGTGLRIALVLERLRAVFR